MKTQTVVLVAVIVGGALVGYYLWNKNQQKTNTTSATIPIGSGGVTASIPTSWLGSAIGSAASSLLSDLGGLFGGGGTQTVATPVATPVVGALGSTTDSGFASGLWDDSNYSW
jgi:hypothetical protein